MADTSQLPPKKPAQQVSQPLPAEPLVERYHPLPTNEQPVVEPSRSNEPATELSSAPLVDHYDLTDAIAQPSIQKVAPVKEVLTSVQDEVSPIPAQKVDTVRDPATDLLLPSLPPLPTVATPVASEASHHLVPTQEVAAPLSTPAEPTSNEQVAVVSPEQLPTDPRVDAAVETPKRGPDFSKIQAGVPDPSSPDAVDQILRIMANDNPTPANVGAEEQSPSQEPPVDPQPIDSSVDESVLKEDEEKIEEEIAGNATSE